MELLRKLIVVKEVGLDFALDFDNLNNACIIIFSCNFHFSMKQVCAKICCKNMLKR